jgi:cytochrome c peroxidase
MRKVSLFFLCWFVTLWSACKKENTSSDFKGFVQPSHFPAPVYPFANNPVTEAGFNLGKKLFYDGRLSRDGSISCGSCHISYSAFSHTAHNVSHGIDNRLGTRNAPALQNLAWSTTFFWDGGVHNLDMLSFNPIQNPVEMDEQVPNVLTKLAADAEYKKMFKRAFGSEEINSIRMMQALSQFMNMLISANTPYDKYLKGDTLALNSTERRGLRLFNDRCGACHNGALLTDDSFKNNGLRPTNDKGRSLITLNPQDDYKFKVPSLRNIEKTAPYMHDGRFETLEQVLNHYVNAIHGASNLDPSLQTGVWLSTSEKADVLAFMKTLTDEEFIRNPLFAE